MDVQRAILHGRKEEFYTQKFKGKYTKHKSKVRKGREILNQVALDKGNQDPHGKQVGGNAILRVETVIKI